MNYHDITKEDMLNGDGIRVVLWVSGCSHQCKNCQNPITWDKDGGLPFDKKAEDELFEALGKSYIDGITFWLYTGYSFDEIKNIEGLELIDVLCDGEFVEDLKDNNLQWVGSSNQKVIDVKQTLKTGVTVLHA